MNVWKDTTLSDGDVTQELIQFFVIADGELKMTGDNASFLVVTRSISSQFENFSGKILENSSKVDRGAGTNALGIVSLSKQSVHTTNWESKTCL